MPMTGYCICYLNVYPVFSNSKMTLIKSSCIYSEWMTLCWHWFQFYWLHILYMKDALIFSCKTRQTPLNEYWSNSRNLTDAFNYETYTMAFYFLFFYHFIEPVHIGQLGSIFWIYRLFWNTIFDILMSC